MEPRSRHVEIGGAAIHYREGGRGTPVVFLHGWIESSWCWHRVIELLGDQYRIYALDLMGYGQSVAPPGEEPYDVASNTAMVERFLDQCVGEPVHLVGHSMGGMISLSIAANRPELVRSLSLVSAPIDGPNAVAPLLQLVDLPVVRESTFRLLRNRGVARFLSTYFVHKLEVPDQMIEDAQRVSPEAMFGSARSILETNLEPLLRKVRAPGLVIFGDKDRIVDINQGALAADRLRDVDFRIFKGCGHCPQVEEPWKVARALEEFFHEASGVPPQFIGATF